MKAVALGDSTASLFYQACLTAATWIMIQNVNTVLTTGQAVAAASVLILTDLFFYYQAEITGDFHVFKENQLLENLQAILIGIFGLAYAQTVVIVQKGLRLFPVAGSLLALSFLLRELDVEKFDAPRIVAFLGSGYGRNTLLIGLWLAAVITFVRNYRHYLPYALGLLVRRSGLFAITGVLCLIIGSLFEDRVFDVHLNEFYEELSEMNGYYFLLLSSLYLVFDLKHYLIQKPTGNTLPAS